VRYAAKQSRAESRRHLEPPERLWLLEEDVDEKDREMEGIRAELRNTNKILTGLLIAIATGAVVGALNLAFTL
jgi:hypothetical protein